MKKLLSLMLAAVMLLAVMPGLTVGAAVTADGLEYETNGAAARITGYRGSATEISIPSTLDGLPVVSIGAKAFYSSDIRSVIIPDSVTFIGQEAFMNCQRLKSITIPNSVTSIGEGAFSTCYYITSVTIPASVRSIGDRAFNDCTGIKDVYYGGSKSQWNSIMIGTYNDSLYKATIHCSDGTVTTPEPGPGTDTGVPAGLRYHAYDSYVEITSYTGSAIDGAVETTYTITKDDVNAQISVRVTSDFYEGSLTSEPTMPVKGDPVGVKKVSLGSNHTAAITKDGDLYVWGWNTAGQLGIGAMGGDVTTPTLIMSDVKDVAAGNGHTLALKNDGTLWAWGLNNYGQLGDGTTTNSLVPKQITSISNVKAIYAEMNHSAAVTQSGALYMWGWNNNGQLGIGSQGFDEFVSTPTYVTNNVIKVSLGFTHTLILKNRCEMWGCGASLPLTGNMSPMYITTPERITGVSGLIEVTDIAAGNGHSVIVMADNSTCTLWTQGSNSYGQLGNGKTTTDNKITAITSIKYAEFASAGSDSTAVIDYYGNLYTFGNNEHGKLGMGFAFNNYSTPIKILSSVAYVDMGSNHAAAIKNDGTLLMWGSNEHGQLGDGTYNDSYSPIEIELSSEPPVTEIPEGLEYKVYDTYVEITGYTGSAAEIYIPSEIEGRPVTSIGNSAFSGFFSYSSLEIVTIPDSVTSIGSNAFSYCPKLKRVTVPGSVASIGSSAFADCIRLATVTIMDGVTSIGSSAFAGCYGLTSVTIPASVTSVDWSAFLGCTSLTDVYYSESKEHWDMISIGSNNDSLLNATIHYNSTGSNTVLDAPNVTATGGSLTVAVTGTDIPSYAALFIVGYGENGEYLAFSKVENGSAVLPADGVKTVKVFCWESFKTMRPLCPAVEATV